MYRAASITCRSILLASGCLCQLSAITLSKSSISKPGSAHTRSPGSRNKDGTVKVFDGTSFQLLKTVEYGDDADNLRYDSPRERVYVGYGSGALGEMDTDGQKIAETKLDAHPESFQLEKGSSHIYVNLPGSRKVAVVDREAHSVVTNWGMGLTLGNYAMALDEADLRRLARSGAARCDGYGDR
jgi:hypothetical protein